MSGGRSVVSVALSTALLLSACDSGGAPSSSGGSSSGGSSGGGSSGGTSPPAVVTPVSVYAVPGSEALTVADVQKIISRAVAEALSRGKPAVIAVTDRVGNVLAVYTMTGAPSTATLRAAASGPNTDAQGVVAPAAAAAISKAITGAYLSSGGNGFSSRTASMIVQQHFPPSPATAGLEAGPLFGVQFSQLPCSDLSTRGATTFIGPKRSPLGLAADPGGFPLYKNGVLVGGVGVMADGDYGFDTNVQDIDADVDENIALAATTDYAASSSITADRVSVDGTTLRFSDATAATLKVSPASAPAFSTLGAGVGGLTAVTGYFGGAILAGQVYGTEASGVRKATTAEFSNIDAFILTNGGGGARYPAIAGSDSGDVSTPLTAAEVTALLEEAFKVMARARAQIRQPLNSRAEVTISVVDSRGKVLGIVRSPDAPIFGIDVSLQKARSAAFISGPKAAADLGGDPSSDVRSFLPATRTFLGNSTALTGANAFAVRSIGNLARPYFPDGQVGKPNGPLSRPIAQFSPFSTGLQSALVLTNISQHLNFVSTGAGADTAARCTFLPDAGPGQNRLQNGLQIFPGGVPVYHGTAMVGAIGVSGDGIDQDDMISFLGLHNAGVRVGGIGQAATGIRADQISISVAGAPVRLRYVNCPFSPFLDSNESNVCQGK
jgi:uncharacterized protein GlcG (DUF336 family)